MSTFSDVLKKRAADIEAPKPLPAGVYSAVVDGPFRQVESKEKKTPGAEFTFKLIAPVSVNDMDMLAKAGGCAGKTMRHAFYLSENNEWRLKQFLVDHLGIEMGDKTIEEMLAEAPGRSVAIIIKNEVRTSANGEARLGYNVEGTGETLMASRDPIPEHLIPKVPESFAPKGYRANLDELARQIAADKPKDTEGPLFVVAESLSNLKFHELMTMVKAIVDGGDKFVVETPYDLASALNVWALKQLSKD